MADAVIPEETIESPAGGAKPTEGLFLRKSSGLVREMGLRGAFGLNFGYLNVGSALGFLLLYLALFPNTDLTWPIILGGLIALLLGPVYVQLVSTYPRSGGDYVYGSRLLYPVIGAMMGSTLFIAFLYNMGSQNVFTVPQWVGFGFSTLGAAWHAPALSDFANTISTQTGILITGFVLTLIALGIAALGIKTAGRWLFGLAVFGSIGVVIMVIEFLTHSSSDFHTAYNHAANHPGAYGAVITTARHSGFIAGVTTGAVLAAIPYSVLNIYGGYWYSSYTGGEVKSPNRTSKIAMYLAVGLGAVIVVIAWLALKSMAGLTFLQSGGSLPSDQYAHITSVPLTAQNLAVLVSGDVVTKTFMALAMMAFTLLPMIVWPLIAARMLFAFSFDRLLPGWMAKVGGRRHVPYVALVIAGVVSIAFEALTNYSTGFSSAFRNVTVLYTLVLVGACLAATILPWRRRELYEASPKFLGGRKFAGIPAIAWAAGVATIAMLWLLYLTFTKSTFNGGFSTTSVLTIIAAPLIGAAVFVIARLVVRAKGGIDVSLAMRELPPD